MTNFPRNKGPLDFDLFRQLADRIGGILKLYLENKNEIEKEVARSETQKKADIEKKAEESKAFDNLVFHNAVYAAIKNTILMQNIQSERNEKLFEELRGLEKQLLEENARREDAIRIVQAQEKYRKLVIATVDKRLAELKVLRERNKVKILNSKKRIEKIKSRIVEHSDFAKEKFRHMISGIREKIKEDESEKFVTYDGVKYPINYEKLIDKFEDRVFKKEILDSYAFKEATSEVVSDFVEDNFSDKVPSVKEGIKEEIEKDLLIKLQNEKDHPEFIDEILKVEDSKSKLKMEEAKLQFHLEADNRLNFCIEELSNIKEHVLNGEINKNEDTLSVGASLLEAEAKVENIKADIASSEDLINSLDNMDFGAELEPDEELNAEAPEIQEEIPLDPDQIDKINLPKIKQPSAAPNQDQPPKYSPRK